jgi:hypothetical protein
VSRWFILGCLGVLLVACQPVTPTATQMVTPTGRFPTLAGPAVQRTLPPTWTPSPTATITLTATLTRTPTAIPTQTAAEICESFELLHDFTDRIVYGWGDYIPLLLTLHSPEGTAHFELTNRQTGDGRGFDFPGGSGVGVEFWMNALPSPGTYDWTLSVQTEVYGAICEQSGTVIVLRPTATPAVISTPPAE